MNMEITAGTKGRPTSETDLMLRLASTTLHLGIASVRGDLELPGKVATYLLKNDNGATSDDLAVLFKTSTATVYRWIKSVEDQIRTDELFAQLVELVREHRKDEKFVAKILDGINCPNILFAIPLALQKQAVEGIVGISLPMQEVFRVLRRVANMESTILILGESGTGKELIARAIHTEGNRKDKPFVPVNCAALPEHLLESELFGHRKGAFSGAMENKKGLFEEADGGTIFLDEIGSLPLQLQGKLLRVLQDKHIRRVGDNSFIYVNVRMLTATNESLKKKVQEKAFREDLYYRLNVIPFQLPTLRERREDIPFIAAYCLEHSIRARTGRNCHLKEDAMPALMAYDWPGNVRELENVLERASALAEGYAIGYSDLPVEIQKCAPPKEALAETGAAA